MKTNICKTCSHILDAQMAVKDKAEPKPGDYSICAYCATISIFDKDLNLVPLSLELLAVVKEKHPEAYKMLMRASKFICEKINKN